jgi:hypothetical protein
MTFSRIIVPFVRYVGKMIQPDRSQMTNKKGRMRFACRITKATDIHCEYVTNLIFPQQHWLPERA